MPEKKRGRDPGKVPERKEQEPNSYHRAAKYPGEVESEVPYDVMQELIRTEPCDLSVYRIRLGELLEYHVAVLGEPPADGLQRRIEEVLQTGEQVELPAEVRDALIQRRREQQQLGSWVERHHFPRRRRIQ